MTQWFLRGVRRGVVTTRYPARPPDPWTQTLTGPPRFRVTALTESRADALVDVCPAAALRRDGAALRYDVGACTACGRCLAVGGDALVTTHEQELAATERGQLVKHIPIVGGP